ncbi:MAG: hypothetical protein IJW77_15530 [Clostridia bacterium]|nr:hypothetical protein [Clostridia bacterium]
MSVRLLGAVLLGAVFLYIGGAICVQWQRNVDALGAVCRLTSALHDGIAMMGLPIGDIIAVFHDDFLEKTGFLPDVRRRLAEDPAADALSAAFAVCARDFTFDTGDAALIGSFFAKIGSEDRAREGERCAYVHTRLQSRYAEAAAALPARCRIAKTVCGALGCTAALMLL